MTKPTQLTQTSAAAAISRRHFVQAAVLAGSVAALSGCAPVSRTPAPASIQPTTATDHNVPVALVHTDDRIDGMHRLLALTGLPDVAGKHVLIKPNFNSADPAPGSTDPALLRSMVETLQAGGATHITVADRSGMGATRQVMAQLSVDALADELGFDLVVLDELGADAWEMIDVPGSHWRQGFPFPRLVGEVDTVIQLCCLKTHRFGGHFTLSLKNSVGLVAKRVPGEGYNYMSELHGSPHQRTLIAEINAAYSPKLVIIDGVTAFVSGGPDRGETVAAQVMLAGRDRVALDAVGVALLRHFGTTSQVSAGSVFAQEQIARAAELGLGVANAGQIELISDSEAGHALAAAVQAQLAVA